MESIDRPRIARMSHGTVAVMLALTMSALAQRGDEKPGPDGNQGNLARVLQNITVQKELALTEEQVTKARAASMAVLEKHRQDFAKALESDNKRDEIRKVFLAVTDETFEALTSILDSKQLERLKQIELQFFGARALGRPKVIAALKPTEEQKKAFDALGDRFGEKMRLVATDSASSPAEKAKKRSAVNDELAKEIANILDENQQREWSKLIGERFRP
ncbi:hypothetical protein K2Y11_01460 [bacterium]|nr:hypothetical protein [bacterium]